MSITNAIFLSPNNRNNETFHRLKTISKSINLYNIFNNENNPNMQFREINSIFNYNRNYKNISNQITKNKSNENLFSPNEKNKNNNSPIKIHLNDNKDIINNNHNIMNTIDYSFTKEMKIERKISAKSLKSNSYSPNKSNKLYKNDSLIFEPFSPKRILTIPTQNNHFGYSINDNGETELLDDPEINEKFNGTKNNSIGPGQYNMNTSSRKRLIIDWSKLSEERLLKQNKKIKIRNLKELGELNKLDNLFLSANIIMNEKQNDSDNSSNILEVNNRSNSINTIDMNKLKNKIFRNNDIRLKDYKSDDDYVNLTSLNHINHKNKDKSLPGPGSYNLSDEFFINPKKKKYQNFGSFVSRNLLLNYKKIKKKDNPIEKYIKYSLFADKNIKNNKYNNTLLIEKEKIFKNSKNYKEKSKIEMLKERNIKNKNEILNNLGPGSYNLEIQKLKSLNRIENFGTLEKRLTTESKDTPGAGSYLPLNDWTKKYEYNFKTIENEIYGEKKKQNLLNKIKGSNIYKEDIKKEDKNKEINIENDPYLRKSIEYDNKVIAFQNRRRPGFSLGETRFKIFKSQINELNGVGKYNLSPLKKNKQQFYPFIYSSSRSNAVKSDNNINVGPGTYNDFESFFKWNKKTYNVKIKNKIDKYKILKS